MTHFFRQSLWKLSSVLVIFWEFSYIYSTSSIKRSCSDIGWFYENPIHYIFSFYWNRYPQSANYKIPQDTNRKVTLSTFIQTTEISFTFCLQTIPSTEVNHNNTHTFKSQNHRNKMCCNYEVLTKNCTFIWGIHWLHNACLLSKSGIKFCLCIYVLLFIFYINQASCLVPLDSRVAKTVEIFLQIITCIRVLEQHYHFLRLHYLHGRVKSNHRAHSSQLP